MVCHGIHAYTMVYHGTMVKPCGNTLRLYYGIPWYTRFIIVYHGIPLYMIIYHGTTAMCYDTVVLWYTMAYHGVPRYTIVYHHLLWYTMLLVYLSIP